MSAKIYCNDLVNSLSATITVSSEATSYEKTYALDNSPSTKWRTTGISVETLLIDFGSATLPEVLAWFGGNVVSGDTAFALSAGTTTAASDKAVALTKASKGRYIIDPSDGWIAYRYWKITVTKASGTYVEFGKIALYGNNDGFTRTYNWNYVSGKEDHNNINPGVYGQINKENLFIRQTYSFKFDGISDTQKILFDETIRGYNFIVFYDEFRDEVFFGIIDFSKPVHKYTNFWNMNASFTEAL